MSGRLFSSLSEFESLNFIGGGMWMPGGEGWLSEEEKICSLLGVDQFRTFSMAGHAMPHRQSVSQSALSHKHGAIASNQPRITKLLR